MKVVTFASQKGGVSKTTSTEAMASGLAAMGYRVIAIDMDPQTNLTYASGIDPYSVEKNLSHVFDGTIKFSEAILKTSIGYDIVSGGLLLAGADMEYTKTGREYMLAESISEIRDQYDYVIVDTPPTLGILTVNALTATDDLIIPMNAEVYSVQGLAQLSGLIDNIKKYCNNDLKITGILITKYKQRQKLTGAMIDQIQKSADQIGTIVFNTKIRESVAVREAQLTQANLFKETPNANAVIDYKSFIEEYLELERK